jgi:hypothetical protein
MRQMASLSSKVTLMSCLQHSWLTASSSTNGVWMLPMLLHAVFVDGQASQVRPLMLWSTGCYTATALFFSFKAGLQDFFAWRWRSSLTVHLQQVYCANIGATCPKSKAPLLQVSQNTTQSRPHSQTPRVHSPGAARLAAGDSCPPNMPAYCLFHQQFNAHSTARARLLATHSAACSCLLCILQSLDNPDQRVAQDLPLLTTSLSEVLTQLAAVPFNIFWYTHLTRQVGTRSVIA